MKGNDEVDKIIREWSAARPDLNFDPLHVLSRVTRISKHFTRIRQNAFRRSELESWEFDVLAALRREGPPFALSPKRLVTETMVSSGTMTNRIDRLVERGLVTRLTDPHDGRGVLVRMTTAGLTRVDAAITRLVDAEEALLGGLSSTEQARLGELLRKLRNSFDATEL